MADSPKDPQPEEGLPKDKSSDSTEDRSAKDKSAKDRSASEIDPELVKLPRRQSTVRPITALAIIAICLTLTVRLLSDFSFSRQGEEPKQVTELSAVGSDLENEFIEIEARPDRPQALRLVPRGKTTGQLLVPVLGSKGQLWILLEASPWNEAARSDERYRGRLTRMDDLGFDDPLKARFKLESQVPRPIALAEIRTALQSKSATVHDVAGDALQVSPSTNVHYKEVAGDTVRVLAVSTDPYNDEAGWSLALQNAGILQAGTAAVSSTPNTWTFDVKASGGLDEVQSKLVEARLFAASASEVSVSREGKWSELSLDGEDILRGEARVGFVARNISLELAPALDSNAFVLNTTETPGIYWYVPLLLFILALLGLIFAFGFYRKVR